MCISMHVQKKWNGTTLGDADVDNLFLYIYVHFFLTAWSKSVFIDCNVVYTFLLVFDYGSSVTSTFDDEN